LAHDTWLVASKSFVPVQEPVRVVLATGEVFPISEAAPKLERVAQFVAADERGLRKVENFSVEDKELAAVISFDRAGGQIVGISLHANFIELAAKDFEEYLADEVATAALQRWRARERPEQPAQEIYTKNAKTILEVGGHQATNNFTRPLGHSLEIVAANPPQVGNAERFRVLLEGKPAVGLRLSAGHEGLPAHTYVEHATTNAEGEATIKLTRPGLWFLRTHVIRPLAEPKAAPNDPEGRKADWESFWASLTFRVPEAPGFNMSER
jgi:uncharacterized GH25 family protein